MTQPPGGPPGHPEPEPMPTPEPDPPMPIPPPEPTPAPEPPHETDLSAAGSAPSGEGSAAGSMAASGEQPTVLFSTEQPTESIAAERPTDVLAAEQPTDFLAGERPTDDFIDAPPTADVQWPPFGAFDDEKPTGADPAGARQPGDERLTEPVPFASAWPPHQPWHAQHEKPGEWHTTPPEHLAFHHSPPPEIQEPATEIVHAVPPPWQVPLKPDADDRRRKTGLWLSVALTTTLLLCGGGAFSAYLLLRDAGGGGAPDPATAVNEFMTAVYTRQDAAAADELVCREARDSSRLAARVSQIKGLANEYDGPTFRWNEPTVSAQTDDRATVSVQLTLSTDDEKTAEQQLTFTTVHKTGWLVCEISG